MGAAPFPAVISTKLSGNWRKDKANSDVDCYARQLDLLEIQGIQKACAMKLINGLQIDSDEQREPSVLSSHYFLYVALRNLTADVCLHSWCT